jgi:multidrug efflux pump subunit AcrB
MFLKKGVDRMPKFSVKKPLTVFVAVLAILVLGVVAYLKMTPDLLPNMDFPYVVIVTTDMGASPETVEADVTKPLEQSMATLNEIKHITSSSQNSMSMVVLEFEQGVNMDSTGVDIQQKIAALQGGWDDSVGTPYVLKINPAMLPVEIAAVSREGMDVAELSEFVEKTLAGKLEGITGVASVSVGGVLQRQMNVILSQEKLDALSAKLAAAVNGQLDAAQAQLEQTRSQLLEAKSAIRTAEENAVTQAATRALESLRDSLRQMDARKTQLQEKLNELQAVLQRKAELDAKKAVYDARIAAVENDPLLTQEQKEEQIAAIKAESGYIRLESDLAELDLRLAALGADWDRLQEEIEKTAQQLRDLQEEIRRFKEDNGAVADLVEKITSGVMTVADGAQQIVSGNVQIDTALTQVESGLATLEQSRSSALERTNLDGVLQLSTISALLAAQNFSMPAGYVEQDGVQYMVSVGDSISTREELQQLVLFDLGMEGVEPIRLEDVAEVFVTDNSGEIYAKLNGENGVIVMFNKQSTYATAEVSENIAARFQELKQEYNGLEFTPLMDQGDYIRIIIDSILSSLAWGALFAILILYLFLKDLRPTVITLVSIPISVIFAVVLMYFCGVTINMISLSGLAVAVGMLVDNSVVVIENIYRLRAKGANVRQAAVAGAGQVLGAITASTLTTVCVFLPIVFVEGITKQLFTDLALTMTFSLLASLIIALTLVPAMAAGMLKKQKPIKPGLLDKIYPGYRRAVSWSLGHKAVVLGAAVVLLVGSALLTLQRGFVFMPKIDLNTVSVTVTMPEGCSYEKAAELADEVTRRAMTVENVQTVGAAMSSGMGMSMSGMDGSTGAYDVTAYVIVPEGESGDAAGRRIVELCRDMECEVSYAGAADNMTQMMTGSGISLRVYGENMEDLQAAAKTVGEAIGSVEGVQTVSDGLNDAAPAVHLTVDRAKAMEHGMTVAQVYMQVASALSTSASGSDMTLDGQDMGVTIALPEERTVDLDHLLDLEITPDSSMGSAMSSMSGAAGSAMSSSMTGSASALGSASSGSSGESFRLGEIATMERTVSLNTINRQEQRRCINVTAQVDEDHNVTKVSAEAIRAVEGLTLPAGVTAEFSGENETIMDAMQQLLLMLVLGILLVYLVMVAQFQSLKSPFIVMFTIPLAFTGGFIILLVSGVELSVVSLIGFVMLVGVIVNNGIVLVDYINQLRLEGMARREAIIEAGVTRLRPILMTSITTILGLLVMAFGGDAGTALMQPMALVCIGGLAYATLMTLLVVPCMYDIISRKELRKVTESDLTYSEGANAEAAEAVEALAPQTREPSGPTDESKAP